MQITNYLPHIDGLRAIAVLSVLFFHVDINLFSGGYVGVDIFFVISGFLITSHLLANISADKFTFKDFYNRRARRLLPALLATIAGTFVVGIFIFPAPNLERLANSSIFSLFSLSNVFFWTESGYFDADATLKPLLHIWSLSVEEQFYLLWPAFLLLIWRNRFVPFFIIAIGLVSIFVSELIMDRDAAAVFFLTPFRIGEFAIGALLVWLNTFQFRKKSLLEPMCLLGFMLIGFAVLGFSEQSRFPGFSSLLPCVGAALLIYAGEAKFSGFILRNRIMVGVGLISYSLYLVHWPIVVFYKYYKMVALNNIDRLANIVAAFILSLLMFYYVEKPFRSIKNKCYKVPSKLFFTILGISTTFLLVITIHASYNSGWQWRFGIAQLTKSDIDRGMAKRFDIYRNICATRGWETCAEPSVNKNKNILVIGDSHAVDGLNIFYQAYPDFHYTMLELGGCPPLIQDDLDLLLPHDHIDRDKCIILNIERLKKIKENQYHAVVVSVLFDWYKTEHLVHAINEIQKVSDAKIIVLGNFIQLKKDFSELVNKNISIIDHMELIYSFGLYEDELKSISPNNFTFISKKSLMCSNDELNSCNFWFNDTPFTYDQHHLSYEASSYLAKQLKSQSPVWLY